MWIGRAGGRRDPAGTVAALCAAFMAAQFVGGKAARDALYLSYLDVTTLPSIVFATAVASVALALASAKLMQRVPPDRVLPVAFAVFGTLLIAEWALFPIAPGVAAAVLYLQVSGLGPLLGSGLFLVAAERFDPHSAKTTFARMVSAGTIGGLAGGLLAERVGAAWGTVTVLPLLAALNLLAAHQAQRLRRSSTRAGPVDAPPELAPASAESSLVALSRAPYLRHLATVVLLGSVAAVLLDYALKAQAVATIGEPEGLLRFFSFYYAGVGVLSFVVQAASLRPALEKLGLGGTAAAPSVAAAAAGLGAIVFPGLASTTVARASESALRGSLFRPAYEIFYTPLTSSDRRAAKSIIDVGFDRLGDAVGAALVALVLAALAGGQRVAVLSLAVAASAGVVIAARRLTSGYMQALERSLRDQAVALSWTEIRDRNTRTVLFKTLHPPAAGERSEAAPKRQRGAGRRPFDIDVLQILALRSGNVERIRRVLDPRGRLTGALVAHVIPLLEWDAIAADAANALTLVAQRHAGELVDALLDPGQPLAVRQRLSRVLAANPNQRAVDGLVMALADETFDVRRQCGRALAAIRRENAHLAIDEKQLFGAIVAEVARPPGARDDRLSHVFTLLSVVLPAGPLRIAYRGLRSSDPQLRGTALEYLEHALPPGVRPALWPLLEQSGTETTR